MPALRISVGFVVKPLIIGSAAISFMPARSAPSAKSFTFRLLTSLKKPFLPLGGLRGRPHDNRGRIGQRFYRNIRFLWPFFSVSIVNKQCLAAGRLGSSHIAPTISDHKTFCEVDPELLRGFEKHSG